MEIEKADKTTPAKMSAAALPQGGGPPLATEERQFAIPGLALKTKHDPKAPSSHFRLCCNRVMLTWSALRNGTLGMISALEQMQLRFPKMKEWIVCEDDRRSADQVATP